MCDNSSKQSSKQRSTSHIWQQYTEVFFFLCFEHTTHLWGFDFSVLGATFLRKCLSINCGTVLSDACHLGTLCISAERACFVNRPSTSWSLYESCCVFLPTVPTQSVECSIFSFLTNYCWRSCQSTAYVHNQTRILKVPVLQLLFWGCLE